MDTAIVKKTVLCAACTALCVALSAAFLALPGGGRLYRALYVPIIMCALVCGWKWGIACSVTGLLMSVLMVGSPSVALIPIAFAECVVYALISGNMIRIIKSERTRERCTASLALALPAGVIAGGFTGAFIYSEGIAAVASWVIVYFAAGLPALVIELVLIPSLYCALEQGGLLDSFA